MIFVTVGWHHQPFNRLVAKMDDIAGIIEEEVIIQKGHSDYQTKHAVSFDFMASDDDFMEQFLKARMVVSHAGAGTLLNSLIYAKPTIVVPRLRRYGEHVNDHQLELVEALKGKDFLTIVHDVDEIDGVLANINSNPVEVLNSDYSLINFIRNWIRKAGN